MKDSAGGAVICAHGAVAGKSSHGDARLTKFLDREKISSARALDSELAKVMVHVKVSPSLPFGVGHPAEKRMRLQVAASAPRELLHKRLELSSVALKFDRLRAADFLINLRRRPDARRPFHGQPERDPPHERSGPYGAEGIDWRWPHEPTERVTQMANSLVRRHTSPLPRAFRRQPLHSRHQRGTLVLISEAPSHLSQGTRLQL
jgi:hypothetical protein